MATLGSSAVDVAAAGIGGASGATDTIDAALGSRRGPNLPPALARLVERLNAATAFDGAFPPIARRLGLIYVCVMIPAVAALSAFTQGREVYILTFVLLASGPFTTPALVASWMAVRRVPPTHRPWSRLWFVGLVLTYMTGLGLLVGLATGWEVGNAVSPPAVVVIAALFILTTIGVVRGRSGRRAVTVDAIEGAIALVVIVAPCVLVWGESVLGAEDPWFAFPAALAFVALVWGAHWALVLFFRRGSAAGGLEVCGVVLTLGGAANAAAQVAQGVSGFTVPAPLPILLHATGMAMLLLVPLNLPRTADAGLGRLPPQAQVRGGGLVALLTLAGVPVLLAVTAWRDERHSWAMPFALGAVALLLVLAALRHLATVRETRRLYAQVEQASEERRALLTQVMQRADADRHRVAAQLHEQAVSAYASFVSFLQACRPSGAGGGPSPLTGASTLVRDDLARHADSLRKLMLTIQPLESGESGTHATRTLEAPVRAYLDSLYGDGRVPELTFSVQDGLVLDWISETIALRIVQEAVRNVWRHSGASHLDVSIAIAEGVVEVRVADDGTGFDPAEMLFESGIGAMRAFAAVSGGDIGITSARGAGTTVTARLGAAPVAEVECEPPAATPDADEGRPKLRLVRGWGVSR